MSISTISPGTYGGLINEHSPSLYSATASAYGSSGEDQMPSPELHSSALPSPLAVNRPVIGIKRGKAILHSASTNDLGASRVRSQVAEPEYHPQSILAGLEKMLAQSSKQKFLLNHPMITFMRFQLKPHIEDEIKPSGRFNNLKSKLVPKRAPGFTPGLNLRSAFNESRAAPYIPSYAIFDPTVDAVRKVFPDDLNVNHKAIIAIIISIRYLDKLPVMDPDSPLSWCDMQLSPEMESSRDTTSFENAPAKARAMLGMEKGMKGLTMQRSTSDVYGRPSRDLKLKGRDRVETIQLELKALAMNIMRDAAPNAPDSEIQRLFVAVSEMVRFSEGFE